MSPRLLAGAGLKIFESAIVTDYLEDLAGTQRIATYREPT
jgi:hypothetical protein